MAGSDTTKFSSEQVEVIRLAFTRYDLDKDGYLTSEELNKLLAGFGEGIKSDAEMARLYKKVDKTPNQGMTFKEFMTVANEVVDIKNPYLQLRQAFVQFDKNGDGVISEDELVTTLNQLGEKVGKAEANEIMRLCDRNGDGRIDYEEFVVLMVNKMQ